MRMSDNACSGKKSDAVALRGQCNISAYALLTCQIKTKIGQLSDLKQFILVDCSNRTCQNQGRLYEFFVPYESLETIWHRFEMFAVEEEPRPGFRVRHTLNHTERTLYLGS